jgi:hypothetical protein
MITTASRTTCEAGRDRAALQKITDVSSKNSVSLMHLYNQSDIDRSAYFAWLVELSKKRRKGKWVGGSLFRRGIDEGEMSLRVAVITG